MTDKRPRTFEEFWPAYVGAHMNLWNRRVHFVGTSLAFLFLGLGALLEQPLFLLGAAVVGYAPAWIGHFFIERNRPATFREPLYSLRADLRMYYLMLNGKMNDEIARLGHGAARADG